VDFIQAKGINEQLEEEDFEDFDEEIYEEDMYDCGDNDSSLEKFKASRGLRGSQNLPFYEESMHNLCPIQPLPKKLRYDEGNGNAAFMKSSGYSGISGLDPLEFLVKLDFEKLVKNGNLQKIDLESMSAEAAASAAMN
jgi:hypothetical protein